MPRGDKSSYTNKQRRMAEHIEEGYESRGIGEKEAERRAWATVNKETQRRQEERLRPRQEKQLCVFAQGRPTGWPYRSQTPCGRPIGIRAQGGKNAQEADVALKASLRGRLYPETGNQSSDHAQCTTIVVLCMPSRSTRPNNAAALPGSRRTQP